MKLLPAFLDAGRQQSPVSAAGAGAERRDRAVVGEPPDRVMGDPEAPGGLLDADPLHALVRHLSASGPR